MSEITIRPLSPERLDDFLHFFDHVGFKDNPAWASCYCHAGHFMGTLAEQETRTAAENRAASGELIRAGRMHGLLAYDGDAVAGWCNAAPRLELPALANWEGIGVDDAEQVGSILCFVVAPAMRRRGVARALLRAACESFAGRGLKFAEAYPRKKQDSDAQSYEGPLGLYREEGFTIFRDLGSAHVVRKSLGELARTPGGC